MLFELMRHEARILLLGSAMFANVFRHHPWPHRPSMLCTPFLAVCCICVIVLAS